MRLKVSNATVNNFFITSTGQKVPKPYAGINKLLRSGDVRYPATTDGKPGAVIQLNGRIARSQFWTAAGKHHAGVQEQVAAALQHSLSTAKSFYTITTAEEAVRQQRAVCHVESSALLGEYLAGR